MGLFAVLVVDYEMNALAIGHAERELEDAISKSERNAAHRNMIPFRYFFAEKSPVTYRKRRRNNTPSVAQFGSLERIFKRNGLVSRGRFVAGGNAT